MTSALFHRKAGIFLLAAVLLAGCVAVAPRDVSVHPPAEALCHCPGETSSDRISVAELARTLPPPPITVAFDVDDTVFLSSPGFHYGKWRYGDDYLDKIEFWTELNRDLDRFSLPKRIAAELITLHLTRRDRILFITARMGTADHGVGQALVSAYGFRDEPLVIFTDRQDKTPWLMEEGVDIFYGDSDGDMRNALEAGARPVRVVRSPLSTHSGSTHPGAFGEEVLAGSEY